MFVNVLSCAQVLKVCRDPNHIKFDFVRSKSFQEMESNDLWQSRKMLNFIHIEPILFCAYCVFSAPNLQHSYIFTIWHHTQFEFKFYFKPINIEYGQFQTSQTLFDFDNNVISN